MKWIWLPLLIFCVGSSLPGWAAETDGSDPWKQAGTDLKLPKRQHPFLFLSKADYRRIADRGKNSAFPWARTHYKQLVNRADTALAKTLSIPEQPGQWSHHYVCKTCGVRLQESGETHSCPRCGKEYSGWPYDEVIAARDHMINISDALTLGLAYQLTEKPRYARRSREILLAYADRYTSFPLHDYKNNPTASGARLHAQTLNEAITFIEIAWAYDLIYNAPGTTAAHRKAIESDLLRPAALVIRRNNMGVSNWQSWHNAAIAAIGFVVEDPGMVNHAINGKSGLRFQLANSVLPDGFWYEGTASYHFYALKALQTQALAMKSAGMDIYKESKFKALYESPLEYTFPDGRFPAVNDSDPISIFGEDAHYEIAYAWYGDPRFGMILNPKKRDSREAFLFGLDKVPANVTNVTESRVFPSLGAVMLRQPSTTRPLALHLDYGPHGGGHGHPDKLGIILYGNGYDVMPDAGRLQYGAPLHYSWYINTLAHNTVIVDGQNQAPTTATLVSSDFSGIAKLATAFCDTAYEDVALTRSVALAPEYMLDVVSGLSTRQRTWDLAYHVYGEPTTSLEFTSTTLPQQNHGYQVLENVREYRQNFPEGEDPVITDWTITFNNEAQNKGSLSLTQAGTAKHVILADGLAGRDVTTCPVVLNRKEAKAPVWITLAVPSQEPGAVDWACEKEKDGWHIRVTTHGRSDQYTVTGGELKHDSASTKPSEASR